MSQKHEASTYGCDYDAGQVGPPTRAPSKSLDPDLDPPSRYVHDGNVEAAENIWVWKMPCWRRHPHRQGLEDASRVHKQSRNTFT